MPLHPEAVRLLGLVESLGMPDLVTMTPAEARAAQEAWLLPPSHEIHHVVDVDADGVPCRLYRANDDVTGLVVWIHGGGWVIGSVQGVDDVCRSLANRTGHAVLSVGYRKAPEHPFPSGLDDATTALHWAQASTADLGVDGERIAIGGDSAGGNLAAVISQRTSVPLRFQLLVYPVTDATAADEPWVGSYDDHADGYLLTSRGMRWFVDHYLSGGATTADDPRVSPLLAGEAALAASPPTLVITAGYDSLLDEGVGYAERLAAAGVPTSHVHFAGQFHGFFSRHSALSDARLAQALAAEALRDALT